MKDIACVECRYLRSSRPPESDWGERWKYYCPCSFSHFGQAEAERRRQCRYGELREEVLEARIRAG